MKKIKHVVICGIIVGIVFVMIKCFVIVGEVSDVGEHTFLITCNNARRAALLSIPKSYLKSSVKQGDTVIIIYTGGIFRNISWNIKKNYICI